MNVIPKGPSAPSPQNPSAPQQMSARDRAIAKLTGGSPAPQTPNTTPEVPGEVLLAQAAENKQVSQQSSVSEENSESSESRQAASTEGTGEPEAAKPEATEKALSPQYAALARKEKALRAQAQQFKAQQESLKSEMAKFEAQKAEMDRKLSVLDRLDKDPWGVLNEKGVTYDQITQAALNQPSAQDQAISKLEARIQAQDEEMKKFRKQSEDSQTQQYQQALKQIEFEATQLVSRDAEFETIKETGSVKDVVDLIERTFKEDGVLLTVEEAAKAVEDHLIDEALKVTRLKKIQQRLQAAAPKPAAKPPEVKKEGQTVKTLTNAVGTTRQLSAKERAILAFQGKLNK